MRSKTYEIYLHTFLKQYVTFLRPSRNLCRHQNATQIMAESSPPCGGWEGEGRGASRKDLRWCRRGHRCSQPWLGASPLLSVWASRQSHLCIAGLNYLKAWTTRRKYENKQGRSTPLLQATAAGVHPKTEIITHKFPQHGTTNFLHTS